LLPDKVPAEVAEINPDLIHLHWLGAGFLGVETLGKLTRPIVWTMHDSWPFTGGCHVPFDCQKYRQSCGGCPILGSSRERDLSRWNWKRKEKAWHGLNLTMVAPSRWLADCAQSSSLFHDVRVEVIPNGLNTEVFHPMDKEHARQVLGLPKGGKIILFGAVRVTSDPNKGFHLLQPALKALGKKSSDMLAVFFGASDIAELPDLGMPVVSLGKILDEQRLAAIYSAADVFVVPSIQEAFCQTATEAMACGVPVVAFGATGLLDIVKHRECGYLAQPYDVDDLSRGILWVLEDEERRMQLSRRARQRAESEFNLDRMAERYLALYREVLVKKLA
jgi:glycosyltransferase involved in cell wall biosynthesis